MRITDPHTGKTYVEKRLRRYAETGQPRELTFSCYRHYPFLSRERTRLWFCQALESALLRFGFQLWAYVIMPEHVHLLVYPSDKPEQMSRFLQAIKQPVARQALGYLQTHAPHWLARLRVQERIMRRHRFWQPGGGYDRIIISTEALRAMIEYIHANPVRRCLVARAEDWEWSSARWYAGIRPVRIELDQQILTELALG